MLITPELKRLEQEYCEFNTSLGDFELQREKRKERRENIRSIIVKNIIKPLKVFYLEELKYGLYKICAFHLHSQQLYQLKYPKIEVIQ